MKKENQKHLCRCINYENFKTRHKIDEKMFSIGRDKIFKAIR